MMTMTGKIDWASKTEHTRMTVTEETESSNEKMDIEDMGSMEEETEATVTEETPTNEKADLVSVQSSHRKIDLDLGSMEKEPKIEYEKIYLTGKKMERTIPFLNSSKQTAVDEWNEFCDTIDQALQTKVLCVEAAIWCIIFPLVILNIMGWKLFESDIMRLIVFYGSMMGVWILLIIGILIYKRWHKNTIVRKITEECDMFSENDDDFQLTLEGTTTKHWYILVTLKNGEDIETSSWYQL